MAQTPKRTWCYTLNNWTQQEYERLVNLDENLFTYHVIGKEVGENGTPHLQGCITFKQTKRFNAAKLTLGNRIHIEQLRETVFQAREYCKKDGDFIEIDNRRQGRRTDLEEATEALKEGGLKKVKDEHLTTYIKYPGGFDKAAAHLLPARNVANPPHCYWIYGATGTGKTKWVFDTFETEDIFCTTSNLQWFDGYRQQRVLLIDDFRASDLKFNNLLRITDRYPYQVEIKGGMVHINSEYIIITSNKSPSEAYHNVVQEQMDQLERRMEWIVEFMANNQRNTDKDERVVPPLFPPVEDDDIVVDLSQEDEATVPGSPRSAQE